MKKIIMMLATAAVLSSTTSSEGMRVQIEQNLLKALFFRPELITTIKPFLTNIVYLR